MSRRNKPEHCENPDCPNNGVPDWRGLQRHHVVFRSQGGKNGKTTYLCAKCHDFAHGIVDRDTHPMWSHS